MNLIYNSKKFHVEDYWGGWRISLLLRCINCVRSFNVPYISIFLEYDSKSSNLINTCFYLCWVI